MTPTPSGDLPDGGTADRATLEEAEWQEDA